MLVFEFLEFLDVVAAPAAKQPLDLNPKVLLLLLFLLDPLNLDFLEGVAEAVPPFRVGLVVEFGVSFGELEGLVGRVVVHRQLIIVLDQDGLLFFCKGFEIGDLLRHRLVVRQSVRLG